MRRKTRMIKRINPSTLIATAVLVFIVGGIGAAYVSAQNTTTTVTWSGSSTTTSITTCGTIGLTTTQAYVGYTSTLTSTITISCTTSVTSGSSSTTTTTTTTTTSTTCTGNAQQCNNNPYWNLHSQKVADLVVIGLPGQPATAGWNSQIGMLHDINEPGCNDYVFGNPCDDTYWTTSDNIPTCWTLGSFGYTSIMNTCITTNTALGAFQQPRDGERYEAYTGSPITTGNACCIHTLLNPYGGGSDVQCQQTGCSGFTGYYSGTSGLKYAQQSDEWNGNHKTTPNANAGVDVAGPQSINAYIRGDSATATTIAKNLVSRWDGVGVGQSGGGYSTWQLGQVMFVMRVFGYDTSTAMITTSAGTMTYANVFNAMVSQLWSIQNSQGYLPNTYNSSGGLGGHDPENMDAGLLPFCYACVQNIINNFGTYTASSAPQ